MAILGTIKQTRYYYVQEGVAMPETLKCAVCSTQDLGGVGYGLISIIEKDSEPPTWANYCFDHGARELKSRLRGVPLTIEVPDLSYYTEEALMEAAINYTTELIDFPAPE